ncbi:MAG TPA: UDP-phosphate N-acetylglucosaminyl 1-phosphate transferase [Usitatibacter sp.]|nr:UDP-phosphate N-acetylglucosaminyl 1-phosphate transferase [Usitatibacter sp.]
MSVMWAAALVAPPVIAWLVIEALRRSRYAALLADVPNERSLHASATPRLGGIGVMAGALPVMAWAGDAPVGALAACAFFLALVSLADDVRSLPIAVRLPAQIAAAAFAILAIAAPAAARDGLDVVEAAFAILALVWMTNLYNFMDGSDGLAGGMALAGFGAMALAAAMARQWPLALACAAIASACLGFLAHNFPPARVFLGDAGSVPLGFLAGALGLHGALTQTWSIVVPIIAFSPFIADASVTLARRVIRGDEFWRAHRTHYYQRLVLAGWSRRRLAIAAYALMLVAAASALASRSLGPQGQLAIIGGWVVLYAALFIAIERRVRQAAN